MSPYTTPGRSGRERRGVVPNDAHRWKDVPGRMLFCRGWSQIFYDFVPGEQRDAEEKSSDDDRPRSKHRRAEIVRVERSPGDEMRGSRSRQVESGDERRCPLESAAALSAATRACL